MSYPLARDSATGLERIRRPGLLALTAIAALMVLFNSWFVVPPVPLRV